MKKFLSVVLCLLVISFVGCTKEDAIVIEKKQWLLVNKKWQLSGMSLTTAIGVATKQYDSRASQGIIAF